MGQGRSETKTTKGQTQARRMISDERFRKDERLAKSKDFRLVYKEGAFVRKGGVVFYWLQNSLDRNRIGFSIRARNVKLASRRNRIKRLLRETYRKNKKILKKGLDMVMVVKSDIAKAHSYRDMESLFLKIAKEAGILA